MKAPFLWRILDWICELTSGGEWLVVLLPLVLAFIPPIVAITLFVVLHR